MGPGERYSPTRISRDWKLVPVRAGSIEGGCGLSIAHWISPQSDQREVAADADPLTHVVSVKLSPYRLGLWLNGRTAFDGRVKAGDCQIVQAGTRPRAVHYGNWSAIHLYVPTAHLQRCASDAGWSGKAGAIELRDPLHQSDPVIERLCRQLLAEVGNNDPFAALYVEGLALSLGAHLLRRWSNLSLPIAYSKGGLASWQLARACDAIASLDTRVTLTGLAADAGLSPAHFSRAFKRSTGVSPLSWQVRQRIDRAKDLLADRQLSLAEIALAAGYQDQTSFGRAFRRLTGMTPGRWRRSL